MKEVYAVVQDDDGKLHEMYVPIPDEGNMFEAIEAEAKERCIRYVTTMMFRFPTERGK